MLITISAKEEDCVDAQITETFAFLSVVSIPPKNVKESLRWQSSSFPQRGRWMAEKQFPDSSRQTYIDTTAAKMFSFPNRFQCNIKEEHLYLTMHELSIPPRSAVGSRLARNFVLNVREPLTKESKNYCRKPHLLALPVQMSGRMLKGKKIKQRLSVLTSPSCLCWITFLFRKKAKAPRLAWRCRAVCLLRFIL